MLQVVLVARGRAVVEGNRNQPVEVAAKRHPKVVAVVEVGM
jgi:hypothetical protein